MTTAIITPLHFGGNFEKARQSLLDQGYIPQMLGKSRFNRRVHRISHLIMTLFHLLGETWKELNEHSIYVLDSFPITTCDNIRIYQPKRYRGETGEVNKPLKNAIFMV